MHGLDRDEPSRVGDRSLILEATPVCRLARPEAARKVGKLAGGPQPVVAFVGGDEGNIDWGRYWCGGIETRTDRQPVVSTRPPPKMTPIECLDYSARGTRGNGVSGMLSFVAAAERRLFASSTFASA